MRLPIIIAVLAVAHTSQAADKIKVLIIDGQNNHKWAITSPIMKSQLEATGIFAVDVSTSPEKKNPKATPEDQAKVKAQWDSWKPDFASHEVVISNYNGERWPSHVEKSFLSFVSNGGGFVCVHAANNSFSDWPEYNAMIGVGGWGGRNEKDGPKLYVIDGKLMRDTSPGPGGNHGKQHEFQITIQNPNHPITKGLPPVWMHSQDELYNSLRGPAENLDVLATAVSETTNKAEPMLMALSYGKGRIFHTALGHADYSMACKGFQETLERGTEWAATGKVERTAALAPDFPTADKASPSAAPVK
jgi:type 1 glutamine amidotransferase